MIHHEYKKMKAEKALNIIAGMCSKKEYCHHDVLEKLRKWELSEDEITKIMTFLSQHHFVDDDRYARAYAEDKFRFNHWGKQKIIQMLRQKNIASDVIAAAIEQLNTDLYEQGCFELLQQKLSTLSETDPYKLRIKLVRFAAGRGFDFDLIQRCLDRLKKEE